ncbi:hypothetical protein QQ045_007943 [Rhodiola kirilowii]
MGSTSALGRKESADAVAKVKRMSYSYLSDRRRSTENTFSINPNRMILICVTELKTHEGSFMGQGLLLRFRRSANRDEFRKTNKEANSDKVWRRYDNELMLI